MAEQDFNINIRTTADTAGIARMEAALTGLGAKVNSINAAGGGGGGGEGGAGLLDKAAAKIEHGIFRTAVHAIGIGVVYELVGALMEASKSIEKTSEELNKQGAALLKNAQLSQEQARFVKDQNEALKISEGALKKIEETRTKLDELNKEEANHWEKFSDVVNKTAKWFTGQDPNTATAPYEEARKKNLETAAKQYEDAKKAALNEVLTSEAAQRRSYEETKKEIENLIAAEERHKEEARAANQPDDYVKAVNEAQKLRKELEGITAVHDKQRDKTQKFVDSADPQVRAILANEKAMFEARAEGRGQDADMFEKSALALRRSASPKQQSELEQIYSSPALTDALKNNTEAIRANTELWR